MELIPLLSHRLEQAMKKCVYAIRAFPGEARSNEHLPRALSGAAFRAIRCSAYVQRKTVSPRKHMVKDGSVGMMVSPFDALEQSQDTA
ncbi:hypothetical protein KSD_73590 [Ktedonobacter sp. SOSP1-85]|nr:hypothetical protein KSD_73590 [Ktedonobacter sp. SOSP1-85]